MRCCYDRKMSPRPTFQLPPAFWGAIAALPDGASRRTRAAACSLETGFWSREIAELDVGDVALATSCCSSTNPASVGVGGQDARVVLLDRATTADLEGVRDHLTAGFWAAGPSDVDDAVAALSAMGGTELRANDVRTVAAIRAAKATTAADRRRPKRRLEEHRAGSL